MYSNVFNVGNVFNVFNVESVQCVQDADPQCRVLSVSECNKLEREEGS